ncbi:secretin N-terminal domain-containing protein [Methylotenera sp. N17]|uniref:secretin N-terminal domain-containing protein n=1 Tax=Methylotenera sp. N17 TaxID=1502761 RepID=UPI001F2B7637|nr:secretin N-terminal domain-containing protein [Methylotenera sp. N17]
MNTHFKLSTVMAMLLLVGCASNAPQNNGQLNSKMQQTLKEAAKAKPAAALPEVVNEALLPPLKVELPKSNAKKLEPRFDLVVNNAPAAQVLMGIVSGTRYSMLLHPDMAGNVSVNLKDVTVFEALDALRDLYGYEYKVDGTRIMIEPQTLQTRVFQVNYIVGQRKGSSDTQVTSGSLGASNSNTASQNPSTATTSTPGQTNQVALISSSISTNTSNDFWTDLGLSLNGIVGSEAGRKVVVNLQSGVIMVRAMPKEIRNVESFLRLMQVNIERQVILEAKILRVGLNSDSQSGVNWSVLGSRGSSRALVGNINNNSVVNTNGNGPQVSGSLGADLNGVLANAATTAIGGPLFAVALQGANFAALMQFLETQGDVEVLSSPRIATINNQKAVLKVGTDEFYITGVRQSTTASVGATTTIPEVTLQPFFSGISLDVTPQIDKDDNIILHMHPSISQVTTVTKQFTLGGTSNQFNLPLPSSSVNETDSIVRTRDGNVIAIGGLMTESNTKTGSKVPGLGDVKGIGKAFRQHSEQSSKSELVILLKSTVVQGNESWSEDMLSAQQRLEGMRQQQYGQAKAGGS